LREGAKNAINIHIWYFMKSEKTLNYIRAFPLLSWYKGGRVCVVLCVILRDVSFSLMWMAWGIYSPSPCDHVVSPRRRNTFSAHVAVKGERRNCFGYVRVVLSISGEIGRWWMNYWREREVFLCKLRSL
jgi:hypothetical protein